MTVKSINEVINNLTNLVEQGGIQAIKNASDEDLYALFRSYIMMNDLLKIRQSRIANLERGIK
ncbi:hypothetical protein EVB32_220 [Rhizobium phage RHph_TM39]|uniref:Uncharacterized protein n=2 Tax=Cuauhnahuacvirus TaxID=3044696 RepID=A0A7S5R7Z3_9CAUD|nr:hypothetical protein PQC16_gp234 [Rhizobium phage RHph_TM30]YP_010671383.1 hypothetical protein PQC17_gp234 [Rhizobium phage RHph_Y65]QIG71705.1 hypothetical protein EVB94_234 [Rhizobium phage RHph_TM40]QIG72068.1 hypothetical protein EVB95_234 [Rhizobium phage RHph_TM2_3B]QIG72430.1 hypothetical protein EVB96_234 [Rhizobium phage RHph_TM3_3_6]QIG77208.1 hypothetical protein EVB32_220 [Rhizobium phage RHph_TM39]QIG77820.1 hypothetical protein EVB64_233 [Rhizobium phage RHph_TM61]